jgi:putative two-component system response regulator
VEPQSAHILVVDDEEAITSLLSRMLRQAGHSCQTASDPARARDLLERERFDLMLCDVTMPGESGLDLVRDALRSRDDLAAIMVTAHDEPEVIGVALDGGAYGYVTKPFRSTEILVNVQNALRRRALELEHRAHTDKLEQTVSQRTAELREALAQLQERHAETIRRLAAAADARDGDTGRHIERMARICALVGRQLGMPAQQVDDLMVVAPMHDIGKIGLPDSLLCKPGPLTPDERLQMEQHTEIGRQLLGGSEDSLLSLGALLAWTHHERWDGRGYPRRLAGEEIPVEARVVAVADVFDALTHARVYRPAFSLDEALVLMEDGRGSLFDPVVLDAFFAVLDDVVAVAAVDRADRAA